MKIILLLLLMVFQVFSIKLNPLSDEFINYINSKQSTWKAGRNFGVDTHMKDLQYLVGTKLWDDPMLQGLKEIVHTENRTIPESFDAREKWPECQELISQIVDQGDCGSCWAVSAASIMTDRRCIHSHGKLQVPVSAQDLTSCAEYADGCNGSFAGIPWTYWYEHGIVTGGVYHSSQGCRSYAIEPCSHHMNSSKYPPCPKEIYNTPPCVKKCDDESLIYENEITFAAEDSVMLKDVEHIQREIMTSGPVQGLLEVYEDFLSYKSGIYQYVAGELLGGHAVRIIGWGIENDIPYWLIANSWNEEWGENGYFRIRRGTNEVGIDQIAFAALPLL